MKVINPTDKDIAMVYLGVEYKVEAGGEESVDAEVANHWKENVHGFVVLQDEASAPVAAVKDVVAEEVVEVVEEEVVEEVKEVVEEVVKEVVKDKKSPKAKK